MKLAIFCLASSLAVVCAGVDPRSKQQQKRSINWPNPQDEANKAFGEGTLTIKHLPGELVVHQPSLPVIIQQPSQPVVIQQPTTTADPMCPEGKSGPCRELPLGQRGSIQVRNDGLVALQFFVEYKVRNQKIKKESRSFGWTYRRTIDIPADAEDIRLTVQGIGLFSVTSDILKKEWKYPVIRCYASKDGQNVDQVGCH